MRSPRKVTLLSLLRWHRQLVSSLTISAKPDGVGAASPRLIPSGEQSGIADAHRAGDGKRFVVRADEKLTAFVELESAIRAVSP